MDGDDEDCYGFGALSDMFDASAASSNALNSASTSSADSAVAQLLSPPTASVKRLDVSALSRFWWSERRLSDFRRSRQRLSSEFQHVAAKFDGQRVEGGLGIAYVVPRVGADESGVLWLQSAASDSNAQARRKKEFQDITNRHDALQTPRGSAKSTSTIFLRCSDILRCEPTAVQHTALGVKLWLRQGHEVELVFMPGPFRGPRARDEFLDALQRETARDQSLSTPSELLLETKKTPSVAVARSPRRPIQRRETAETSNGRRSEASPRPATRRTVASSMSSSNQLDPPSNGAVSSTPRLSDEHRAMVRQYVRQRDSRSSAAIEIASKLHTATGYRIGPLSQTQPQFSADSTYRKETVGRLSKMLEKMNQEWKDVESERETRTKAKCTKDEEDVFQYTDTDTKHQLSPEAYRRRYLEFVGANDVDPIIRLCPPPSKPAARPVSEGTNSTSTVRTTLSEDHPCFLLGFDIAGSCIIDDDFFRALRQAPDLSHDPEFQEFASTLETYFKATQAPAASSAEAARPTVEGDTVHRKRNPNRRHSLVSNSLETIQELQSELAAASSTSDSIDDDITSIASRAKKRRRSSGSSSVDSSGSLESTPSRATTGRRRRRQSLVGSISLSSFEDSDDSCASHLRRSPRLIRSAPQTPKDRDVTCPLCYDATAVVRMHPCNHAVCRSCWLRLGRPETVPPSLSSRSVDVRQCPWDRDAVVER